MGRRARTPEGWAWLRREYVAHGGSLEAWQRATAGKPGLGIEYPVDRGAQLRDAAPELAEALRELLAECSDDVTNDGGDESEAMVKASAALKKAGVIE